MHCDPNSFEASEMSLGLVIPEVFIETLSAPDFNKISTSSMLLTPPPTVNGINT